MSRLIRPGGGDHELQTLRAVLIELRTAAKLNQLGVGRDGSQRLAKVVRSGVGEVLQVGVGSLQQFGMAG